MIESFRNKALREFFEKGRGKGIRPDLVARIRRRLDAIENAEAVGDLNLPGFDFHSVRGKPQRYSIHVNGPWCITFEWSDGRALRVDLEQYH